jgi:membrane protein implicated in regulation of membrane protease activity
VAERASTFRTGGAGWWVTLAVLIGALAALAGTALGLQTLPVAIAAGVLAAVLPHVLDRRKQRRRSSERRAETGRDQPQPQARTAAEQRRRSAPPQRA